MSIKDELLAIKAGNTDDKLYPQESVDWAQENAESDLHGHFLWDNEQAGNEHRLAQARRLIMVYVVTEDRTPILISLTPDRVNGGGYRAISDVLAVPDLTAIMLRDAFAELERVEKKYYRLKELSDVFAELGRARANHRSGRRPNG